MEVPRLSVHLGLPSHAIFQLPDRLPEIQQNVTAGRWLSDPKFYNYTLDIRFPFTWAALYMATVLAFNQINKRRKNRPWAFSRFRAFRAFVVMHNLSLALLSAWAFWATCEASLKQVPAKDDANYLVHIVDKLCRTEDILGVASTANSRPWTNDLSHVYEVWYIAWIFYLLKFYEVVDTAIILASGRESSILQTYHHTGVMLCAWASLRFIAPSAYVPLLLNSAIHTFMVRLYRLPLLLIYTETSSIHIMP
jgi:hypothetical protein